MKTILMLAFALFTVTLNTACPRDIADKVVEQGELTKEYDSKMNEASSISTQLELYNINISLGDNVGTVGDGVWSNKLPMDLQDIKAKLDRYLELAGRLAELQTHENLKSHVKASEIDTIRESRIGAKTYSDSLNAYLQAHP